MSGARIKLRRRPLYYSSSEAIPTARAALDAHRVDELKRLLALIADGRPPTHKPELIAALREQLECQELLRTLWDGLDETQQAAVADVVHAPSPTFHPPPTGLRARSVRVT